MKEKHLLSLSTKGNDYMLALIQIVISIILTVLFGINSAITFTLIDVLTLILIFLLSNIAITIIYILLFVVFVYTTEKIDYRK